MYNWVFEEFYYKHFQSQALRCLLSLKMLTAELNYIINKG